MYGNIKNDKKIILYNVLFSYSNYAHIALSVVIVIEIEVVVDFVTPGLVSALTTAHGAVVFILSDKYQRFPAHRAAALIQQRNGLTDANLGYVDEVFMITAPIIILDIYVKFDSAITCDDEWNEQERAPTREKVVVAVHFCTRACFG